jgi:hypothetical protein
VSDQPPPPAQPPERQEVVYVERRGSGMAVAALVCGIVGAVIALIPILGIFGIILGLLGLIFGLVGWSKARKGQSGGKGMAISGAILGALAIALGIWGLVIVGDAFDQLDQDLQEILDE